MITRAGSVSGVIASGVRGDTRRYRTFHLYEQCRILGLNVLLSHVTDPHFQQQVEHSNLLVLHRAPWDLNIQRSIDTIHRNGGWVFYDTDDLLFDVDAFKYIDSPDFADPVRAALYQDDMKRHRRTMEACDAIMTSTQYLADQAVKLGVPTYTHQNGFSSEMLALAERASASSRSEDRKVVIGYASGTPTHNLDFDTIGPALQKTFNENDKVTLWLIGPVKLSKAWTDYRSRIIHLPHVPWRLLPAYLSRFDINLAPLIIDNPFAQSKSEIKWMEAALVRIPTIASGTGAFVSTIEPGVSGMLATSRSEWQDALDLLLSDNTKRRAMGNSAHYQALQAYSPAVRAGQLLVILQQVTGLDIQTNLSRRKKSPKPQDKPGRIQPVIDVSDHEKRPSLLRMAFYSARYRGMLTVAKQVWVFFRRMVSPLIPYHKSKINK